MAPLLARLQQDLNTARKAQHKGHVTLLGTIISEVKNREIEVKRDLTDDDVVDVIRRGIKKRRESIEMYDKGARADLAATGDIVRAGQVLKIDVLDHVIIGVRTAGRGKDYFSIRQSGLVAF